MTAKKKRKPVKAVKAWAVCGFHSGEIIECHLTHALHHTPDIDATGGV